MSKDELIPLIFTRIPYPSQIMDLDTTTEPSAIRFTWRGNRFRVTNGDVDECRPGVLSGSDIAILMKVVLFGKP